jgi:hypothetical protein
VNGAEGKGGLTLLLGLVPLTDEEKRKRRRLFRVVTYADAAVLFVLLISFSKEWWASLGGWLLINAGLLIWYFVLIRRATKEVKLVSSPEDKREAQRALSSQVSKSPYLLLFGGVAFLVAGVVAPHHNPLIFALAAVSVAMGVGLFIWIRRVR